MKNEDLHDAPSFLECWLVFTEAIILLLLWTVAFTSVPNLGVFLFAVLVAARTENLVIVRWATIADVRANTQAFSDSQPFGESYHTFMYGVQPRTASAGRIPHPTPRGLTPLPGLVGTPENNCLRPATAVDLRVVDDVLRSYTPPDTREALPSDTTLLPMQICCQIVKEQNPVQS